MLLKNKKIIIFGLANKYSIAAGIAKSMIAQGATIGLAYQNERLLKNIKPIAEELGIDIKKHNAMLPENDEYNQFTQKHQLLESGKVRHTWTLKKKKKEKKNDTN